MFVLSEESSAGGPHMIRKAMATTATVGGLVAVLAVVAGARLEATGNRLYSGQQGYAGQSLTSTNGQFILTYQYDGNLVLRGPSGPIAATFTYGVPGVTVMQTDGNLVVYSGAGVPVWASGTSGNPGAYLEVQNDGRIVIYGASGPVWAAP